MKISEQTDCSLALGTAQFGLDYGITNAAGKPSLANILEILSVAVDQGIAFLDTASGYGDSEKVLGRVANGSNGIPIITKTPNWAGNPPVDAANTVVHTFNTSLKKLNRARLTGLMVHFARDLLSEHGADIWTAMTNLKAAGKVDKLGISFYADDPIDDLATRFSPDFVQVPVNVFDQRLVHNSQLKRLHSSGVEVHARSVFLQGIALTDVGSLPGPLRGLKTSLTKYRAICKQENLSQLEGALAYARSIKELSHLIVGVTTPTELSAVCRAFEVTAAASIDWAPVNHGDPMLVDPRYWPKS
jgi:aryl-alcohol dehydrogenase-like predicted oxidoreductase